MTWKASVLVAVAWVASAVAASGFVSLLTGREVVPVAAAGPLAAPAGVVLAGVLLAVAGSRRTPGPLIVPAFALLAWGGVLIGSATVTAITGGLSAALRLVLRSAASPFLITDALLAAVAGAVVLLLARRRRDGAGPPHWPWEGRE